MSPPQKALLPRAIFAGECRGWDGVGRKKNLPLEMAAGGRLLSVGLDASAFNT